MKYVVCVPDGCADEPFDELGGRTPLEVAHMPVLAGLAARSEVGRAAVIPEGFAPGSDVGNMSILGYDPARFHTGRAPIEAAALGLKLPADRLAYRTNLVTVGADGTMVDFAGGHPDNDLAAAIIAAVDAELGTGGDLGLEFHPGVQYRHIMVAPADWLDADCTPPHDITDQAAVWPTGAAAQRLRDVMEASREIVARFDTKATQIWLWGQGFQPQMTPFAEHYGRRAGMVTAVDLVRGLGVLTDMEIPVVEGANGWYDTNYEGKRDAAIDGLASGADLYVIHVEATDEAGIRLRVTVSDTGIGVPADAQPHLFSSFTQSDTSTTRRFGGTGLGLTISSRLVHMMGGTLKVESELGAGSESYAPLARAIIGGLAVSALTAMPASIGASSTGTGGLVRATSPTLVTPALGTPSSGTLTNCTGLPVAGGGTGRANSSICSLIIRMPSICASCATRNVAQWLCTSSAVRRARLACASIVTCASRR